LRRLWLALLQGLGLGYGGDDIGSNRVPLTFQALSPFGLVPHACEFSLVLPLAMVLGLQLLFPLPSPFCLFAFMRSRRAGAAAASWVATMPARLVMRRCRSLKLRWG